MGTELGPYSANKQSQTQKSSKDSRSNKEKGHKFRSIQFINGIDAKNQQVYYYDIPKHKVQHDKQNDITLHFLDFFLDDLDEGFGWSETEFCPLELLLASLVFELDTALLSCLSPLTTAP